MNDQNSTQDFDPNFDPNFYESVAQEMRDAGFLGVTALAVREVHEAPLARQRAVVDRAIERSLGRRLGRE